MHGRGHRDVNIEVETGEDEDHEPRLDVRDREEDARTACHRPAVRRALAPRPRLFQIVQRARAVAHRRRDLFHVAERVRLPYRRDPSRIRRGVEDYKKGDVNHGVRHQRRLRPLIRTSNVNLWKT